MVRFIALATIAALTVSFPLIASAADPTGGSNAQKKHHKVAKSAVVAVLSHSSQGALPASVQSAIATITSGVPTSTPSYALATTYSAGQENTFISGAPPLPAQTAFVPSNFPPLDQPPPLDSPQAKKWLKQYDLSKVPNIPLTTDSAACASNPQNLANAAANHWWTCGGYVAPGDITECPDQNTWGLSYDDGPSPYTPKLLDYLEKHGDLKTTFFIVGSRAISRPDMVQYEYMKGHQLSVHTWSHTALTTQTNEQILLELAWTKEVIRSITGVTPNTMRPPYGDIDDRVRAICKILGLTPIIWTSDKGESYDTNDWKIQSGLVDTPTVARDFMTILDRAPRLGHGYIVLEHDLYEQAVDLAVDFVLPMAQSMTPKQQLEPIITCLKQPLANAYVETNSNSSSAAPSVTGTSTPLGGSNGAAVATSGAADISPGLLVVPGLALVAGFTYGLTTLL